MNTDWNQLQDVLGERVREEVALRHGREGLGDDLLQRSGLGRSRREAVDFLREAVALRREGIGERSPMA